MYLFNYNFFILDLFTYTFLYLLDNMNKSVLGISLTTVCICMYCISTTARVYPRYVYQLQPGFTSGMYIN